MENRLRYACTHRYICTTVSCYRIANAIGDSRTKCTRNTWDARLSLSFLSLQFLRSEKREYSARIYTSKERGRERKKVSRRVPCRCCRCCRCCRSESNAARPRAPAVNATFLPILAQVRVQQSTQCLRFFKLDPFPPRRFARAGINRNRSHILLFQHISTIFSIPFVFQSRSFDTYNEPLTQLGHFLITKKLIYRRQDSCYSFYRGYYRDTVTRSARDNDSF